MADVQDLISTLQFLCQFDDYEVVDLDGGKALGVKFPILGSDPECYFEAFNITQDDGFNIINLTEQKENIMSYIVD